MISVYELRGIEQGIEQGVLRGQRTTLIRQIRHKFGPIPDVVAARLEEIGDASELDRLTDAILTANTIEEMEIRGLC